ncbi:WD repeat-containing protein 91 [Aplysia californica]|uniref:WD repeat-containing protein 91 n=1 Tax=Aplysia californica TaxID=6500 RepID=A0ABM0JSX1_APLCA|nr:WD repeat-containing protein 91 [Aplysia californica]
MASSCEKLDQLVKDYLLFRGFSATLKTLDQELKTDKDKGLRVDRMMEQIWTLLSGYDLPGLREYWRYLNQRLFSRLEQRYASSVRKLESSLLKLYVVNAHQCNRQDKVLAFFEQMGGELQTHADFKDWFAFPFVSNPAENPMYSLYFQKQWQDTLQLSLHNFLSVVLQAMPVPTLLNVEFDARRMKTLQEENSLLKQQLLNSAANTDALVRETRAGTRRNIHAELHPPSSPPDMVYDFSGLASDADTGSQEKQKPVRRFPLSLTSPLGGRRKSENAQTKSKSAASSGVSLSASASGGASTSGGQSKTAKVTEMSIFPPPAAARLQSESKKSQAVSMAASTAATSASSARQLNTARFGTSSPAPRRSSPVQPVKQQAHSTHESISTTTVTQSFTSRSLSVPNHSAASFSKLSSQAAPEMANKLLHQWSEEGKSLPPGSFSVETDLLVAADCDSPFLLLEDEYREHGSTASFCRFSVTGQYIASLDVDGIVKVWMWSPQPATQATIMSKSAFLSLSWVSKSDRWLLLGNKTGSIRLFDVKESKTFREVMVQPDAPANCMRVTDLSTNPSSSQFVCATSDHCPFLSDPSSLSGRLLQWDLRTLKLERALMVESSTTNAITCSCYSRDGQTLATGGADGWVRLYDANQQKAVKKWQAHEGPIHSVQFHASGSVYSMAADGKLSEWSMARPGQLLNSLKVGQRNLTLVSPGSTRGRLFALDVEGQHLLTYSGRRGAIYKGSGSSALQCIMELKNHMSPVITVDWSPSQDTRVCLTSSVDGKIKISTLLQNDGKQ